MGGKYYTIYYRTETTIISTRKTQILIFFNKGRHKRQFALNGQQFCRRHIKQFSPIIFSNI